MALNWVSLAWTVLVGVFAYIVFELVRFLLHLNYLRVTYADLPGPVKDNWLHGNLSQLPKTAWGRLQFGLKLCQKFPFFYRFWVGPKPSIVLNHPDTIKVILKTAEPKSVGFGGVYRHGLPWLGQGLLIAGGSRWARSRRLLTPAFHFDVLMPYMAIYNDCAEYLLKNLEKYTDSDESFEVFQLISACTLDVILRCAFSYQTDCQNLKGETHPYVQAVSDISEIWSKRNRNPLLFPDIIFYLTSQGRLFNKQCKFVHKVAEDVIDRRKKELDGGTVIFKKHRDFLDILLTAKDENGIGLTREEIRNEVDTFLFEGYDTTASAISWILYSLAEHPEHQIRVQDEIDSILSDRTNKRLEWDDMHKLEYLTRCIKEGMRLHSPVPFIQRESTREFEIHGHKLPKGTPLSIAIWLCHHNALVWGDDHMEFKPERFEKENISKMDSFAFIPFSAGPRNCIGQTFALNEERTILARILQKYSLELDKTRPAVKKMAAVMRTENGMYLKLKRRKVAAKVKVDVLKISAGGQGSARA